MPTIETGCSPHDDGRPAPLFGTEQFPPRLWSYSACDHCVVASSPGARRLYRIVR